MDELKPIEPPLETVLEDSREDRPTNIFDRTGESQVMVKQIPKTENVNKPETIVPSFTNDAMNK